MSDPGAQEEHNKPSLSEVLDWKAWETWAMFLGAYLGMATFLVIAIIVSQSLLYDFFPLDRDEPMRWAELALTGVIYSVAAFSLLRFIRAGAKDKQAPKAPVDLWFQAGKSAMDFVILGLGLFLGTTAAFIFLEFYAWLLGVPQNWAPYQGFILAILLFSGQGLLFLLLAHYKHPKRKRRATPSSKDKAP